MEMGQSTRKKTGRRNTGNFPTPKHGEVACQTTIVQPGPAGYGGQFSRGECWTECRFVYLDGRAILANNVQPYTERREDAFPFGKSA